MRRPTASVLVAFLTLAGCTRGIPQSPPHPSLAQPISSRTERTVDGRTTVRVPAPGKVTVIDVWATSCAPCIKLMPAMQALSTKYAARGLVVLGVAVDDNPGLVLQRLRELGITYPNVIDAEGSLRGALRVKELPTTLVIDRAGIVRLVRAGGDAGDMEAIEQAAEALLEETKQ